MNSISSAAEYALSETQAGIVSVVGSNFSGRTEVLRRHVALGDHANVDSDENQDCNFFIGPDIHNHLSGLANTVGKEIELHMHPSRSELGLVGELYQKLGQENKNPFELSGGEQVVLSLLSAFAYAPKKLSIDCALEQLSMSFKELVLEYLGESENIDSVYICDNRIAEVKRNNAIVDHLVEQQKNAAPKLDTLSTIYPFEPCEIRLCDLAYGYGDDAIFSNIDFTFTPGKIYHLDGDNGVGKTTLAKVISGVLRPLRGEVIYGTEKIVPWRTPATHCGLHMQNPDFQLYANTVEKELRHFHRLKSPEDEFDVALMAAFGLQDYVNTHPLDLPFVLRKRLALAVTLNMRKPWLILDEPTLGQDGNNCLALAKIIAYLAQCGMGIILISHSQWFKDLLHGEKLTIVNGHLE